MSDLTGIASFCDGNLPGFATLKYVPVKWLADGEYEEIIYNGNFQLPINPSLGGAEWLTLPFEPIKGDGWKQDSRRTSDGMEYPQTVGGIIRNVRPEVDAELMNMERHRFLIHLTDQNSKQWLIGREHEPLVFSCEAATGGRSGGLNSYTFRFTGTTTKRAFGYVPIS